MEYGSSRPATTKCESRIGDRFPVCIGVDVTVGNCGNSHK